MYLTNKNNKRYIVLDVEANGLRPDKLWCVVWKELGVGELHRITGHKNVIAEWRAIAADPDTIVVGHNAVSYDVPVLNRLSECALPTSRVVDTQVLSFLYYPKLPGGHSLAEYGDRFGIPKVGADIEQWDTYDPIMLARCARDVEITERLFTYLRVKMNVIGFSEFSCWIEHFVREAIDEQEAHGFFFDLPKAYEFQAKLQALVDEYEAEVYKQFPPELKAIKTCLYKIKRDGSEGKGVQKAREKHAKVVVDEAAGTYTYYDWVPFNLGSPQQRVKRLEAMGYKAINFTKKTKKGGGGNPQVDEDGLNAFLEECPEDAKPAVQALSKWLVASSRLGMVTTWIGAATAEGDSTIHGTVWSCGAGSRRCTHTDPNTANIPSGEAPYGAECRSLWRARPGRVLVGCDAKAVQMRMFAHRLGNVDVGMQYVEGDPHQRNADAATIECKKEVPRKKVKNCFYGMIFGAQDPKLGKTAFGGTGTPRDGANVRRALYATTPGLEDLFAKAAASYDENNGWMELMDGGWVRCPAAHAALNYWIQGDEAVLMKLTVIWVRRAIKRLGLDAFQVGFIHDEVQYDCHPDCAEQVADLFKEAIALAGERLKFIIPMAGDSKQGPTWAETH